MKTEDLIIQLASEAGPVRPVAPLAVRLMGWVAVATGVTALVTVVMKPRPDLLSRLSEPVFLGTTLVIFALALTSAVAALALSVPDDRRPSIVRAAPFAAVGGWAALLLWQMVTSGSIWTQLRMEPVHASCLVQIAVTSIVPAAFLVRSARAAAPLEGTWTGVFAVAAALAAGAVSSAITCPLDRVAHQAWWHLLPVLALALAGPLVGVRWLDRLR